MSTQANNEAAKETWERETWQLTFTGAGVGAPVVCRIRRLLKAALRAYGLRCTDHRQIAPPPPPPEKGTGHA
jgi:hypothetical protein